MACVLGHVLSENAAHAAPVVVPPEISEVPAPSLEPDEDTTVELELTVDAHGAITDVRVVSHGAPEYEAAALAAISAAHATAATRDGVPVAARIRYAYAFRKKEAPLPSATNAAHDEPEEHDDHEEAPPPRAPSPVADEPTFGARAVTDAPPREATARTMNATELATMGTRGDPIRAVELLPGIARNTLAGPPIIRGSAPYESQVFFEGAPVPLLYHFGGITSFVPARFVDRVDYYPGNFSARYGRVLGGVIDVKARDPRMDGFHGGADVSFIDASAFAEGPFIGRLRDGDVDDGRSPRVTAAVGARRSYVDLYLSSVLPKDTVTIDAAPVYYDYQGIVAARLSERHQLRVLAYGSQDTFALVSNKPSDDDPALRGRLASETGFHRVQATLKSLLSDRVSQEATVSFGTEKYDGQAGTVANQAVDSVAVRSRLEWTIRALPELRFVVGVDHASQYWTGSYDGVRPTLEEPTSTAASVTPLTSVRASLWTQAPALYAEAGWLVGDRVMIMPSIRGDYLDQVNALTFDPRLAVRAKITDTTTLKGGVGRFTQQPNVYEALPDIGNPNIKPGYAIHYSAGVEQAFGDAVRASSEVFLKTIYDLPIDVPNYAAPHFDNQGRGRAYGVETEVRVLPKQRAYGLLTYTLSRSERGRVGQDPLPLFEHDQTHVGAAAAVVRIGAGWEASATFRVTSASPRTPVTGSVLDVATGVYTPRYDAVLSDRGPLYHRLDLHVEKGWVVGRGKLTAYLDIQNVYNATNPEFLTYNYDYTKSAGSPSFPPFLPSLGIRGEL
jgi:TonB family protein